MILDVRMRKLSIFCTLLLSALFFDCSVSYKFNGASIDYDKVKTISIKDFTNQAELVYAPLEYNFNETLRDIYRRQTKLKFVPQNGDLHLEGEITQYYLTQMGAGNNDFATTTKLTMAVRVRYTNNVNHNEDFEQTFSASETFDSSTMLSEVEQRLTESMTKNIVDMIYNATVANW